MRTAILPLSLSQENFRIPPGDRNDRLACRCLSNPERHLPEWSRHDTRDTGELTVFPSPRDGQDACPSSRSTGLLLSWVHLRIQLSVYAPNRAVWRRLLCGVVRINGLGEQSPVPTDSVGCCNDRPFHGSGTNQASAPCTLGLNRPSELRIRDNEPMCLSPFRPTAEAAVSSTAQLSGSGALRGIVIAPEASRRGGRGMG